MSSAFWTVLAVIAMMLTAWGYLGQTREIRLKQSGRSVSFLAFAGALTSSLVKLIYGGAQSDTLFSANALVCSIGPAIAIVWLLQHKKLRKAEMGVGALLCALTVWAFGTTHKEMAVLLASVIASICHLTQPAELAAENHPGTVDVWMFVKFGVSAGIWALYSWHSSYPAPTFVYSVFAAYQAAMVLQWRHIRNKSA